MARRAALALLAGLGAAAAGLLAADDRPTAPGGGVEAVAYGGWKNNLRLSNGTAELVITLDVGPRVICYKLAGGPNVMKEFPDQLGKSGESDWQIRGGHRLWVGPEDTTRTYAPDNGPVHHERLPGPGPAVRVWPAADTKYGVQKQIDVSLAPTGSVVTLVHRVINVGKDATELAPWALTVLAPGGTEIIPLPPKRPHPGSPKNARTPADFAPNQALALWPFFDFKDPRWSFGSKYITLRQDDQVANQRGEFGSTKLGVAHRAGWVGYHNNKTLFVKRFTYQEGQPYPDRSVNFETFTAAGMLEAETLGPLVRLVPGQATELTEVWELYGDVGDAGSEDVIDKNVLPRVFGGK
jgi:hypothetical protein